MKALKNIDVAEFFRVRAANSELHHNFGLNAFAHSAASTGVPGSGGLHRPETRRRYFQRLPSTCIQVSLEK